ncbi:lipase family protein [Aldersonia sp. NBC_00410]|uniref:lipase family protein n=1 Tax=Aldersonia sp. NBC_00410 TaxID=2975954 RepID=UPI002258245B|nr:lipase family protein [Aldersonia sp. NBC_00410]MCX5042961.1 lipase family protein [Aldersonia sp. NBC_00410]
MVSRTNRVLAWLGVLLLAVAVAPLAASAASAAPNDFYAIPDPLPGGRAGDVVRTQPFPLALPLPASARRIMYLSNDTHDQPAVVTGTYLKPTQDWTGPGPRPLVVVAPGTQGQGDQCAPSKLFGEVAHYSPPTDFFTGYEVSTAFALLARGMGVVVTDYHGLGTGYMHDYVNRLAEAHAVLDAARAVDRLTDTGLQPRPPVAIFGYSQGGGAAAAAAELQGSYAPELDVRGTYAGAPPADLGAALAAPALDGGFGLDRVGGTAAGLLGYVLNGLYADYPQTRGEIDAALNPAGKAMLAVAAQTCVIELSLLEMFRHSTSFTTDGRSAGEITATAPNLRAVLQAQRIGGLKPVAPVLIAGSVSDDVIPFGQVRQLAVDWCAQGATIHLDKTDAIPPVLPSTATGHLLEALPALVAAANWVVDRFEGRPAPNNCGVL